MLAISEAQFEQLVADVLDLIPVELADQLSNLVVLVEAEPPPGSPDLLGLYEGTPLTERDSWYGGVLPDRITLFRGPILRACDAPEDVVREVRITVIHEVAHHLGIDDYRLDELGWVCVSPAPPGPPAAAA